MTAPRENWVGWGFAVFGGLLGGALAGCLAPLHALLIAAGVVGVAAVFASRLIGLLVLLAATCFVPFNSKLPFTAVASINTPDLLLWLLLGLLAVRVAARGWALLRTPLTVPVLSFCAVGFVSLAVGVLRYHVSFFQALHEARVLAYYLGLLLLCGFIAPGRPLKRLLYGCFFVGTLVSLDLLVRAAFGTPALASSDAEEVYYAFAGFSAGGGNLLVYWCFCCGLSLLIVQGVRMLPLGLIATSSAYFAFMFHRHMYVAMAFAVAFTALVALRRHRRRLTEAGIVLAATLVIAAAAMLWGPDAIRRYAALTGERFVSLVGIEETSTVSLRMAENRYAWQSILDHPVIGLGFAEPYRPPVYTFVKDEMRWFIHNGYLWVLVKMGLVGFVPFVWMLLVFFRRGLTGWLHLQNPFLSAVALGTTVAGLGLSLVNMGAPYFMQDWGVFMLGLMMGINETLFADAATGDVADAGRAP